MTARTKNIITTAVRIVLVIALTAAIIFFVFMNDRKISTKEAGEVMAAIEPVVKTEKMEKTSERFFKKYYGLNPADYDGIIYYAPVTNMDAEELLIVKLKDLDQADEVLDAIEERADTKTNTFEGYAPEQYELCRDRIIDRQGNYILFVVGEDAEKIDSAYRDAL